MRFVFCATANINTIKNSTILNSHLRKLPKFLSNHSVVRQSASSCGSSTATKLAIGGDNGADHVCAVLSDGGLKCWGANDRGQLGIGTTTNMYFPTIVNLGEGVVDRSVVHNSAPSHGTRSRSKKSAIKALAVTWNSLSIFLQAR